MSLICSSERSLSLGCPLKVNFSISRSSFEDVVMLLPHQLPGHFHRFDGVFRIAVGLDLISPLLGYRGSADQDLYPAAQPLPFKGFDNDPLLGHGRGEQRGESQDMGLLLFYA